jgi:hypothetical protein
MTKTLLIYELKARINKYFVHFSRAFLSIYFQKLVFLTLEFEQ